MFTKNSLLTSVCAVALVAGSPVFSEVQSTQILEEYFDVFKSTAIEIEVGDKEDNIKSSQWNNVTLKSSDGKMQIAVPWIKVSKKLSGGFALTIADQIDGAFQTPDPEVLEPVRFVVESKNMVIDIDGQLGAREYNSKFGEVTFRTL
ncbi:MAG: hypothetical protein IME92_10515, partial [Proteobacteria bacterium]|nr:hypothetical protein [Pseudomonadota bacterium]